MITVSKKIFIRWKVLLSPYAEANKQHIIEVSRTIGSSLTSVNKILSNGEEQRELMREILGLSPNSPDWDKTLSHYWHSLSVEIPSEGKELEIGYIYDYNSVSKKVYIDAYNSSVKEDKQFKSSEDIAKYFEKGYEAILSEFEKAKDKSLTMADEKASSQLLTNAYKVKYDKIEALEQQKYKFGNPINVHDYILYRYCLVYSHVANEFDLVNKSNNIRFYLHSEEEIKAFKEEQNKLERARIKTFLDVAKDVTKIENVLYAVGLGNIVKTLDKLDYELELSKFSTTNTKQFLQVCNNSNLETMGLIEKYIMFGVLRRLEGTTVIVDGTDPSLIIGNNMEEAITYFTHDKNKAQISEFVTRFKGLPKQ